MVVPQPVSCPLPDDASQLSGCRASVWARRRGLESSPDGRNLRARVVPRSPHSSRWRPRTPSQARRLARPADSRARALARRLLSAQIVTQKIFAVRHLRVGERLIPVQLSRNDGGSVAGRALLSAQDTPIVDGPDAEAVLAVLRDAIDGLLLARQPA